MAMDCASQQLRRWKNASILVSPSPSGKDQSGNPGGNGWHDPITRELLHEQIPKIGIYRLQWTPGSTTGLRLTRAIHELRTADVFCICDVSLRLQGVVNAKLCPRAIARPRWFTAMLHRAHSEKSPRQRE